MESFREIRSCRVSGSKHLVSVLSLGTQVLTGVFPRTLDASVSSGPLELLWCPGCGLLQLKHSFDPKEMYGETYGYRSGLNLSMVKHLSNKASALARLVGLSKGDTVLDIGSNDGTLLRSYEQEGLRRIGIDPTGEKFRSFYTGELELIPTFFSAESFRRADAAPPRIVTSIAMFYDLDDPIRFAREVGSILAHDGVWHFEQSYMPSMLRLNAYDTICHEHLEYYSLGVVLKILEDASLRITDVVMNNVNGGSFAVTAVRAENPAPANDAVIDWLLGQEERMGLGTPQPYRVFEERVYRHREDLRRLIRSLKADGKRVLGYGASTKGNVVLQFCGLGPSEIDAIADVNPDKFGCYTPGTGIPIVSEEEAHARLPDYYLVLPWHFKHGILERERDYLSRGGKMIFPFPEIEIV